MRGYTLIEMLVVIAIVVILSSSIFVYINFFRGVNFDAGVTKLASDIRYAQGLAMSTTNWYGVTFNASPTNTYSIYTTTGTLDTIIDDPSMPGRALTVNVSSSYNASISSVTIQGGGSKIEFNPLGQPYTDKTGSIIASESTIVLSAGTETKTIRITPNTGKVIIE